LNSITDLLSVSDDELLRGENVIVLSKLLVSKYGYEKFRCHDCGRLPLLNEKLISKPGGSNRKYFCLNCWRKIHY
jgi:hypothetical protein